jgi:L-asparaginase
MTRPSRPSVLILGTGGTIASTAAQSTVLSGYTVTEGIDSLLDAVPEVNAVADVRCEQFCNVDSRAIDNALLLRLAKRINLLLARTDVDGLVVTHGTDTLEATAYFLNLTVKSNKPVVLTGSMRPASALSADGPLNLFNAVVVAADPASAGHGVLAVMNDRIMAARFLTKAHTTQVDAFQARDQGCLGFVHDSRVRFEQTPLIKHTTNSQFNVKSVKKLPMVDIIYDHQNAGTHFYQAAMDAGTAGLVIAAPGNGSLTPNAAKGVNLALKNNIICVRASRVQNGIVSVTSADRVQRLLSAHTLSPIKARILLTLALIETKDIDTLQSWFEQY